MLEVWIAINRSTHKLLEYTTEDGYTSYMFNDCRTLYKYMRQQSIPRHDYMIIAGEIVPLKRSQLDG